MTINAKEKIINKIDELLPEDSAISSEDYENEKATELFYKLPCFFYERQLLEKYHRQYAQYGIKAYNFANGLKKLISYYVLNGEYRIEQTLVTDNLESGNVLVNLWNKYELKALQQFFIKAESPNSIFGFPYNTNKERNIECNETEVELENKVIGRFSRISENNNYTVYAEKYMAINRLTYWELMPKDITTNIELEILYRHNVVPVFADLLNLTNGKSLLEGTSYCASNYNDAKILVTSVNVEVDAILRRIEALIKSNNYESEQKVDADSPIERKLIKDEE